MLILLSPAKIQNFDTIKLLPARSFPEFMDEAAELMTELQKIPKKDLPALLNVNNDIASRSYDRYYNWSADKNSERNAKNAIYVYAGEVYRGLKADTLTEEDLAFAQTHLRMFSALYGLLKPTDLIRPYRLEMNAKLPNSKGKDLYALWKEKLTGAVNAAAAQAGEPNTIANLASAEYFKSLDRKKLNARVIHFDFLNYKNGVYKPINVYLKKARGMMARYIIKNRISQIEDLKGFYYEDYWFNDELSTEEKFVFTRG